MFSAITSCRFHLTILTRLHNLKCHSYSTLVGNFCCTKIAVILSRCRKILITYCILRIAALFSYQLVTKHGYSHKCCYFKVQSIGFESRACHDFEVKLLLSKLYQATNKMLHKMIILYMQHETTFQQFLSQFINTAIAIAIFVERLLYSK